ncbi:MAG TPA: sigma factor [Thermodesulfobacteriota bacterium]|nr:sigma factor [Thermodesulfobacteriota bacterium]
MREQLFGISRKDQERSRYHGWWVRFWSYDKKNKSASVALQKTFSDFKFGGKEEALAAAIKFRDEHIGEFPFGSKNRSYWLNRKSKGTISADGLASGLLDPVNLKSELSKFGITSDEQEDWKQIEEYGGRFLISSYGRVVSLYKRQHLFKGSKIQNGKREVLGNTAEKVYKVEEIKPHKKYDKSGRIIEYIVQFHDPISGKNKNFVVGLTVAKYFLPNPCNSKRLIWKDFNKLNCRVDNLQWRGSCVAFNSKEEYIQHLKHMDVGERKSEDITGAIIDYLSGNENRIEEILKKTRTVLYWKIYNIVKCPGTADDLAQESMLKIYQKINEFKFHYPKNPVGWFIRIAQNVARNYISKMKNEKLVSWDFERFSYTKDEGEEEETDFNYSRFMQSNRPNGRYLIDCDD